MTGRSLKLLLPVSALFANVLWGQMLGTSAASLASEDRSPFFNNLSLEPVGPGDLVYLSVTNWTEVTRSYRIAKDGTITLPVVAHSIHVSGLSAPEIEKTIAVTLTKEKILVDPLVSANVVEYRSKAVDVAGAVRHPLTFQALGRVRLLDAIARAEGVSPEAGTEVLVTNPIENGGSGEVQHISLKRLIDGSDPSLNQVLQGGEQIRIPQAGKLYILGNVKAPGAYPVTEAEGITVLKALALSQGLLPYSQNTAIIFRPKKDSTQREEVTVSVKDIVKHHSPDIPLNANDILYIPDNSGKKITAEVLEKLGSFGGSTASGLLIFR
ncbi:MAG: polysaccharide biosynthesis/export family protein [Bryobacteraceae bacterium]